MPPKKFLTSSTPAITNNAVTFKSFGDSSGPSSIEESSLVIRQEISDEFLAKSSGILIQATNVLPNKKLSTLELMIKAIEVVGVPRKGASYIAILRWITNNQENAVISRLKTNLKKSIIKALEIGSLKRANASKNATGLRGFFIINRDFPQKKIQGKTSTKKTVSKKENKIERTPPTVTEVTKKPLKINAAKMERARKIVPTSKTAILGVTKATSKVVKGKATSVMAPKVKNASAPKEKNASAPKEKNATAPKEKIVGISKKKNAMVPKEKNAPARNEKPILPSISEVEVASTSEEEFEIAAISKPKIAKTSKLKAKVSPISKSKTKVVDRGEKELLEKTELIPKLKSTEKEKEDIFLEISVMTNDKQVTEKLKKKVAPNVTKVAAKSSRLNPGTNLSRKDLSDTELTVKPDQGRKSLKSYSSDTEVDVVKKEKAVKATRGKIKLYNTKKSANEIIEAGTSKPKASKQKAKNAA